MTSWVTDSHLSTRLLTSLEGVVRSLISRYMFIVVSLLSFSLSTRSQSSSSDMYVFSCSLALRIWSFHFSYVDSSLFSFLLISSSLSTRIFSVGCRGRSERQSLSVSLSPAFCCRLCCWARLGCAAITVFGCCCSGEFHSSSSFSTFP